MKKLILLFVVALPLMAQNGRVQVKQFAGYPDDSVQVTYTNSQIDTVIWYRQEPTIASIGFSAIWQDSVRTDSVAGCTIKRVYGTKQGTLLTVAGDTLAWSSKVSTQTQVAGTYVTGFALTGSPTFTPLADAYLFIIKYRWNGNAVAAGKKVRYIVHKIYNER